MEQKLIAAVIKSRDAFDEVLSTQIDKDLSDQASVLWKLVKSYYGSDPEACYVDTDVLKSMISREQPKHKDMFVEYIDSLGDVSINNVLKEAIALKLEATRHRLAQELTAGKDTKVDLLLEQYNKLRLGELEEENGKTEIFVGTSLESILEDTSRVNRIGLLPSSLNNQLRGGVLRKHHVVVFAPTEMGKSLFGLNMTYGFVKQGLRVLYCGNEDPAKDMVRRFLWRLTGMTEDDMEKEPEKAKQLVQERDAVYSNLIFAEMSPGSPREIEELVSEYKPDVLIVDQIRHLDMGDVSKVLQLEAAAAFMRRMGKTYNLVPVSFTQAADSATGKMLLGRGDIDFSNVGIPGTADLLLGIGATEEMEAHGERMISFVKNKVSGKKMPLKVWFDPYLTKVQ